MRACIFGNEGKVRSYNGDLYVCLDNHDFHKDMLKEHNIEWQYSSPSEIYVEMVPKVVVP